MNGSEKVRRKKREIEDDQREDRKRRERWKRGRDDKV